MPSPALPLSILSGLICATGGSFIFAGLYLYLASVLSLAEDSSVFIVRNYTFLFVFTAVFTTVHSTNRARHAGGRIWVASECIVLLIFFAGYMTGLWPQKPVFLPYFTVRAFLWFGGAAALAVVVDGYCSVFHRILATDERREYLYRHRLLLLWVAMLVVAAPLVYAIFSGGVIELNTRYLLTPLFLIAVSGIVIGFRFASISLRTCLENLIVVWYPVGWCFLSMPVLLFAEFVISDCLDIGRVFLLEGGHLVTAFLGFAALNLILLCGCLPGRLLGGIGAKTAKSKHD